MELHFREYLLIIRRNGQQVCLFPDGEGLKIPLLHWYPFLKKPFVQKHRTLQNPLLTDFRIDVQKDLQIISITKIRMVAVTALNNIDLLR